jgi:anti-anti-sigma factor
MFGHGSTVRSLDQNRRAAMCIHEEPFDAGVLWRVEGRLTHGAGDRFERGILQRPLDPRNSLVLDLGGVSMIDAGGVGALMTLFRACAARGVALSLFRVPARVNYVLTIVGLSGILPIVESVEQALPRRGARSDAAPPAAPFVAGSARRDGEELTL